MIETDQFLVLVFATSNVFFFSLILLMKSMDASVCYGIVFCKRGA